MIHVQGVADLKAAAREHLDPAILAAHPYWLRDDQWLARGELGDCPHAFKQPDELFGAPVERRDLIAVYLDEEIVDPETRGCGKEVFDGSNSGAIDPERCGMMGVHHELSAGWDLCRVPDVMKDDSVTGGCGPKRDPALFSSVEPDPFNNNPLSDCLLLFHNLRRNAKSSQRQAIQVPP